MKKKLLKDLNELIQSLENNELAGSKKIKLQITAKSILNQMKNRKNE